MKRLWILATIIMLLITFYQISTTYAKYTTEINTQIQKNIGKWAVKINDTDIANGVANQEFTIQTITYNSDEYVMEGKVAPGLTGYFDIAIDATDASVAVLCNISIDFSLLNIGDAIQFTDIKRIVDEEETTEGIVRTEEHVYTTLITLDEIKADKIITVRFYVEWEDDNSGTNDANDTTIGSSDLEAIEFPITVEANQYLGEEITEYTEQEEPENEETQNI